MEMQTSMLNLMDKKQSKKFVNTKNIPIFALA